MSFPTSPKRLARPTRGEGGGLHAVGSFGEQARFWSQFNEGPLRGCGQGQRYWL